MIENIKHEISNSEQLNKIDINLTADPNVSYGIIHEVIEKAKNKHMLSTLVKFDKYKHKRCEWITYGLLKSIRFRDKLYKKMKLTNPASREYQIMNINLKTYNKILKEAFMRLSNTS